VADVERWRSRSGVVKLNLALAELPEPVDVAILGVGNERLEEQLAAAAAAGAAAAVLFAGCHEPPRQGVPPLAERLRRIAASAGMVLCGGNGMGFLNLERHLRACGYYQPLDLVPGGLAFLTHSGSAFSALLHNDCGLACNLAVSCGQELTTTIAAYLDYAADLPSTRVVALFVETARDPDAFRAALAKAAARDLPVVALKVGRSGRARVMVAAGGVLVELLGDRRFGLAPLGPRAAGAMLDRLTVRPLLDGVRGAGPADLDAVAGAVARLSVLAADLGDLLDALDVNPVVAGPDGCVAVDALVVPRGLPAGGDGATARS
jgi:ATP-grasp domain/Succinyl-CoA ligase like flavodoxin domain